MDSIFLIRSSSYIYVGYCGAGGWNFSEGTCFASSHSRTCRATENKERTVKFLMPASLAKRRETAEKNALIWRMFLSGIPQRDIANQLELSESRISKVIKQVAAKHPITNMSIEERAAAGFELCLDGNPAE